MRSSGSHGRVSKSQYSSPPSRASLLLSQGHDSELDIEEHSASLGFCPSADELEPQE